MFDMQKDFPPELLDDISCGNLSNVLDYVRNNIGCLYKKDGHGMTIFLFAAVCNQIEILYALLTINPLLIMQRDFTGKDALSWVIEMHGDPATLELLINSRDSLPVNVALPEIFNTSLKIPGALTEQGDELYDSYIENPTRASLIIAFIFLRDYSTCDRRLADIFSKLIGCKPNFCASFADLTKKHADAYQELNVEIARFINSPLFIYRIYNDENFIALEQYANFHTELVSCIMECLDNTMKNLEIAKRMLMILYNPEFCIIQVYNELMAERNRLDQSHFLAPKIENLLNTIEQYIPIEQHISHDCRPLNSVSLFS